MRHRVQHRKLGRTSAHRKALFRNQLTALFTHERIITTLAKAKELRPIAEKLVTLARNDNVANRRKAVTMVPDKGITKRLFEVIAPRFSDRPGGYTRIMRLGRRRGDGAELAIIEFVDFELSAKPDSGGEKKASLMDRAKGMLGGGKQAEEVEAESTQAEAVAEEQEQAEVTEEKKPKKRATKAKKAAEPEAEEKPKAKAAAKKTTKKAETKAEEEQAEEKPKKKTTRKPAKKADEKEAAATTEEKPKKKTTKKADAAEDKKEAKTEEPAKEEAAEEEKKKDDE